MLIRTGLPGAVVQRSLADWPVVLAAWLLLVCATTLLATGVVYGDAVASGGLQRALLAAPPATRALDVALTTDPGALGPLDAAIRPELARAMAATGGDIVRIARSGSYADASTPQGSVKDLTIFESVDGVEQRATLSAGAWPTAGRDPIEVTVSDRAAAQMGIGVGDTLALVGRLNPTHKVDVTVTGIRVVDPADAIWLGEELETTGTTSGGTFTTRGPLGIREADLVTLGGSKARFQVSWRGVPTIANLRVDGVEPLGAGADGLATRLRADRGRDRGRRDPRPGDARRGGPGGRAPRRRAVRAATPGLRPARRGHLHGDPANRRTAHLRLGEPGQIVVDETLGLVIAGEPAPRAVGKASVSLRQLTERARPGRGRLDAQRSVGATLAVSAGPPPER